MSGEVRILVKPRDYSCLYFCPHFYMAYRGKIRVKKILFAAFRKETLLYCDSCLKEQIQKHVSFDSGSRTFFDEVKNILIQYYPPITELNFSIVFR